MTNSVYFANMGRIRIDTTPGEAVLANKVYNTLGVIKKIEIKITWEFAPLRGMNSILRQGLVKYNQEVEVSAGFGMFDIDTSTDIFAAALAPCLDGTTTPTRATQLSDTGVLDTNKVKIFNVEAFMTDEATVPCDGTPAAQYVIYTVNGCYFETVPLMTASENEWIVRDLACKGRDVKIVYTPTKPPNTGTTASWYPEVIGDE